MTSYYERIAADWIEQYSSKETPPGSYDPLLIMEAVIGYNAGMGWLLISTILEMDKVGASLPMLVAGPLDSWMSRHSADMIDFIEIEAATNERFKWALGGLRQNSIAKEVWNRIERARGEVWSSTAPPIPISEQ